MSLQDFLAERLLLDAIVTVVDAKHIEQHLDEMKPEGVENEACPCPSSLIDLQEHPHTHRLCASPCHLKPQPQKWSLMMGLCL